MFERVRAAKYINQIDARTETSLADMSHGFITFAHGVVCPDRDFAALELSFYYFFLYDYRILHKLSPRLREAAADVFSDRLMKHRKATFADRDLAELFDNRMQAYWRFMKDAKKVGDFTSKSSDYINVLLSISIDQAAYARGRLEDIAEMRKTISPDLYTDLIHDTLVLNSWALL